MKRKAKWLGIFMVMGLVIAACSPSTSTTTTEAAAPTTTQAATPTTGAGPTTTEAMAPPATDFGVDLDGGTISVGVLADLTGPFSGLVIPLVDGYKAQIDAINAAGGIHGLQIVLDIRDTAYSVDNHVQLYNEIHDDVVAIGQSTGSPHTNAIRGQLAEDQMFAVPLSWYSGWADPALNANVIPHGEPYCIESMNTLGYLLSQNPDAKTIAIASNAGDFGEDSAEGAKLAAAALGLTVVYDGQAKVNAADEATLAEVATGIVGSSPDIVWVTTSPGAYAGIYGQALAAGVVAKWSGSFVAWNRAFLAPEAGLRDAIQRDWTFTFPFANWSSDAAKPAVALMKAANPDVVPGEFYIEGIGEAILVERILNDAFESGDLTRAGVLAAAKAIESMSWDGLWPDQGYVGATNDIVQRLGNVVRPSAADYDAGGSGVELLEANYTSDIAAAYQFDETCFNAFG